MADEKEDVIIKAILWLQDQQESLKGGFRVDFREKEFFFYPTYIERHDKKMDRLLTGEFNYMFGSCTEIVPDYFF